TVQDSAGATVSGTFSITVNAAPTLGALSPSIWTLNQPGYSGTITVAGGTGPFSNLAVVGLPPGLTSWLSGHTITISRTPTPAGSANLHVSVVDAAGVTTGIATGITIVAPITLGSLTANQWTVGQSGFNGVIPVSGGAGTLSVFSQSNMPPGLTATVSGANIV